MLKKIEKILTKDIRPYLSSHYGDVEISSYEDGTLYIRLLGQCHNCPSAKITVEDVIESKIRDSIPEIKEVVLKTDVSEELYNFAKDILNKNK